MNIGLILASGSGSRMGNTPLPKQFLLLGEKPIIIHTLEQFLLHPDIDHVVVSVNEDWISHTKEIITQYIPFGNDKISVISGGAERSETVYLGSKFIVDTFKGNPVIVSHDAVRPFITQAIITDNILKMATSEVVDTIIQSADTIVRINASEIIEEIPERKFMHLGQTPQSFKGARYIELYDALTPLELEAVTDVCKMYADASIDVHIVEGSQLNFKITTQFDHKLAQAIVKGIV